MAKGIVKLVLLLNSHQYTFTNSTVPNTETLISNSTFDDLSCGSGESLVDTPLSIFKDVNFIVFIILDLTGDHVILPIVYIITKFFFFTFELIFIFYFP